MATFFRKTTRLTRGLRFRLSLVYSGLFGICMVLLSLFITGEYMQFARDEFDQFMRNFAVDLSSSLHHSPDGSVSLDVPLNEGIKYFPFLIQDTVVSVRSLDGRVLYANRPGAPVPFVPELARSPRYTSRYLDYSLPDGTRMRALNLKVERPGEALILQVASKTEGLERQESRHFLFLLVIIPASILVAALVSMLVVGRALDPVRSLIQRMEELLASGDRRPLPIPDTHDEIGQLTQTFNTMLEQLQRTLEAQEQFVSHSSHQLNTPLAIMRGELAVLRSRERSPEEIQRFHASLEQELQRLSQLVKDMLLASRVEAGKEHFHFTPVALDEVLGETLERLAPHAKRKGIALRFDLQPALVDQADGMVVNGERQLLGHLFENLVENAIKYSPVGGQVAVRLLSREGGVVVEVADQGPGPDQALRERLERPQRFWRGENTSQVPGSGLGLYLVSRIAGYHGAALAVRENSPAGTVMSVAFRV